MIITITLNPSIDRTVTVKKADWGGVNRIVSTRLDAGGKGINVSKVLDVLDVENIAIGAAGRDNYRDFAPLLRKTGVDNDFILLDGLTRTNIKINDKSTGLTTDLNEQGLTMNEEDMERLTEVMRANTKYNDIVVISGSLGGRTKPRVMETLVKDCKEAGAYVIADTSGQALQSACNGIPYMITPNYEEFCQLTKDRYSDNAGIVKAAREIISFGIHTVVVTMGAQGMIYVTRKEAYFAPALKVKPVCTVGAGDAVTAAMAFTMQWGMGSVAAIQLATSAGAAAVQTEGSDAPKEQVLRDNARFVEVVKL